MRNIFLFFHIPKTAGTTLIRHIEKSVHPEQRISLYWRDLKLKDDPPIYTHEQIKKKVICYLKKVKKLKNIYVIYGHRLPYGIHDLFEKEPFYFTFFRNPISRIYSIYNHKRRIFENEKDRIKQISNLRSTLLYKGCVPDFNTWIKYKYNKKCFGVDYSVKSTLEAHGFLDKSGCFDRFNYIGITEKYDNDSLYLYDKLRINKFFINQNVSKVNYISGVNEETMKLLCSKIAYDQKLYEMAVLSNLKYQLNEDYRKLLFRKGFQKKLLLPFTQTFFSKKETVGYIFGKIENIFGK